jgi:leader peptidase (prepilin peptidase)/N-methyltransferase
VSGADETESARLGQTRVWESAAAALLGALVSFILLAPIPALFGAALALLAVWIARVDIDRLIIPDLANIALLVLGLVLVLSEAPASERVEAVVDAVLRGVAAGGLLWLLRFGYRQVSGRDGLGLGDVKLMAAGAPFLAWTTLPYTLVLAAAAAIILIGLQALHRRQPLDRGMELPFGAFLAPAIWAAFLLERLQLL